MWTDETEKICRITEEKYADIMEMHRPDSPESRRKHPRMSMENRAKIFAPFAALRGYEEELDGQRLRSERENRGDERVDAEWMEYSTGMEEP